MGPAGFERTVSPPPNTVPPWYKRRAPGLVGIDQLNFQLPLDAPEGCAVPLKAIGGSFKYSQSVTISIHKGGGACQDPPPSRKGIFYWTEVVQNGEAYSIDDTFEALFTEAPPVNSPANNNPLPPLAAPNVQAPPDGLDAGQLQVMDRFGNLYNLTPSTITGKLTYLPSPYQRARLDRAPSPGPPLEGPTSTPFNLNSHFLNPFKSKS